MKNAYFLIGGILAFALFALIPADVFAATVSNPENILQNGRFDGSEDVHSSKSYTGNAVSYDALAENLGISCNGTCLVVIKVTNIFEPRASGNLLNNDNIPTGFRDIVTYDQNHCGVSSFGSNHANHDGAFAQQIVNSNPDCDQLEFIDEDSQIKLELQLVVWDEKNAPIIRYFLIERQQAAAELSIDAPVDVTFEATGERTSFPFGSATVTGASDTAVITNDAPDDGFSLGDTIVTWTVTDGTETATDTQTVTVQDTAGPVITGATDVTADATDSTGTTVTFPMVTATDAVDGDVSVTFSPDDTTVFTPGTHTVTVTATDSRNNDSTVTFTVTVTVNAPDSLSITAPEDITQEATGATTTVSLGTPTITGTTNQATNDAPNGFPVGTTTVTWTVTEGTDTVTATQTITIVDTTGPTFSGVQNVSVDTTDPNGRTVTFPTITATDTVDGDVSDSITFSPDDTATFVVGTTQVTVTATDSRNNDNTATFDVVVTLDTSTSTPLSITAPADVTVEATGATTAVTLGDATIAGATSSAVISNDAPNGFPVGTTTVTWTVTDGTNTATDTQIVTITDPTSNPVGSTTDTTVEATALICGIEVRLYNTTADRLADMALPDDTTGFSFGTLQHGDTSDTRIIDFRPVDDTSTTLRIFGSDWNDFDGNFVMNGNQTHVSPRQQDNYGAGFPLNSTGQYAPDGVGPRALPTGDINDARDAVILPEPNRLLHIAALILQIPEGANNVNPDGTPIIDETYQGSIHQDLTLQFEC